ncbi:MAG: T9SS type A sorting domain-containing protein [Flavobacteriales bacterium]|jgi:hypothetical protein|nr:T9SS type A sorting domain-containing protein [Flavobacteriales bacterium]
MKKQLLLIVMLISLITITAQSPLWTLPGSKLELSLLNPLVSSSLPTPTVGPYGGNISWPDAYDGRPAEYTHNIMHDANGELLFFMLDGYIYDKNGWLISQEFAVSNVVGAAELFIVPMPKNCNKFYIFTTQAYPINSETYYGVLDMSAPSWETGPLGYLETEPTDMVTLLPAGVTDYYKSLNKAHPAACIHRCVVAPTRNPNDDRYIFVKGDTRVFRYKLTSTGLVYDNYDWSGNTGIFPPPPAPHKTAFYLGNSFDATEMELVLLPNGNYRMAFEILLFADVNANTSGNSDYGNPSVCIIDIDPVTMEFIDLSARYYVGPAMAVTQKQQYFSGLEFNKSGELLYMTHSNDNLQNAYISVLDLTNSQLLTPTFGQTSLADLSIYERSQIELGIDGNMYLTSPSNLAQIANPGIPNSATISAVQSYSPINVLDPNNTSNAQRLYYLPSQLDTEDAFARFTSSCCKEVDGYTSVYTANTGVQTWSLNSNPFNNANGVVRVESKITIPSGANVTMENMTFLFDDGATLIIEKGARVTLDNTTLTSDACNGIMWNGVELHGDRNAGHYYADQGYLEMKSGSMIENAIIGITTKKQNQNAWDWNSTGGIIRAKDSYFINNKRDVEFLSYHFNPSISNPNYEASNRSRFTNCLFRTTDDYIGNSLFPRITLWDVNGVNFKGCKFEDNRTTVSGTRGEGIISINASYQVSNSDFEDLEYGVKAYEGDDFIGLFNGKHIEINKSTFNSLRGIYFNGLDKSDVSGNIFNTDDQGISWSPVLYGMYLDNCKDYTIQENTFNNISTKLHGSFTWGVIASNRSGEPTEIFKNTFNNHPIGIEAIDQNRTTNGSGSIEGLEIKCNEFANTVSDIYVANSITEQAPVKGIRKHQGNPTIFDGLGLSDNLFASSYTHSNYGNENEYITYYHHDQSQNSRLFPQNHYTSVTPISSASGSYTNTCATSQLPVIVIGSIANLTFLKSGAMLNLNTAINTYNSLIDGGSTAQLEAEVASTTDQDAYANYMDLMDKAGYLSDEVLMEVAKKEDGFTLAMIRNILVANPQSAKIKELDEILDNRINQLPQYMRNQIKLGKTTLSTEEFLALEVSKYRKELDQIIQAGIEYIAYDTISYDSTEALIDLVSNTGLVKYELQKLKIAMAKGNQSLVSSTLSTLNSFDLTDQENKYIDDLTLFNNLKQNWEIEGYQVHDLPQSEIDKLKELVLDNRLGHSSAQAILALNNESSYIEPAYMPDLTKSMYVNHSLDLEEKDEFMLLYPNPTTDFVSVRYKYLEPYQNLTLSVTDILGKQVYSEVLTEDENEIVLSLKDYTNGSYIITITADEKVVYTDKVVKK